MNLVHTLALYLRSILILYCNLCLVLSVWTFWKSENSSNYAIPVFVLLLFSNDGCYRHVFEHVHVCWHVRLDECMDCNIFWPSLLVFSKLGVQFTLVDPRRLTSFLSQFVFPIYLDVQKSSLLFGGQGTTMCSRYAYSTWLVRDTWLERM